MLQPRSRQLGDGKGRAEWERSGESGCSSESRVRKQIRTSPQRWALAVDKGGDAVAMAVPVGRDGMAARSDRCVAC
jgi:hypothetical protein